MERPIMFTVDSFLMQAIPLVSVFMVFYVIVIRPGRMSERKRWASVKALEGGEKIRLASGMKATFIELHGDADSGEYEVEIGEGLRVRVFEAGIVKVIPLAKPAAQDAPAASDEDPADEAPREAVGYPA